MENNHVLTKTYKRKPQIWFGTEADSFPFDFIWTFPLQM